VLAQPGDHPDRPDDAQPPGGRQQQLLREGARLLSQLPAAGGVPDGVLRQVAHGAGERRPAAGVRQVGELPRPGRVLPPRGAHPQRGRTARPAEGLHHRRAHGLRDGVAPEGARPRQALLPVPEPQGGAHGAAAGPAPRPPVRRGALPHPRERGEHTRELPRQADVGLQPAQHLARDRLPLQHRHEDVGVPEGLLRHPLRRGRQRRPAARLPEGERPGEGHDGRVHLRQRVPDRRPRPHRQAQRLRGIDPRSDGGLRPGPGAGGRDEPGAYPQPGLRPHLPRRGGRAEAAAVRRRERAALDHRPGGGEGLAPRGLRVRVLLGVELPDDPDDLRDRARPGEVHPVPRHLRPRGALRPRQRPRRDAQPDRRSGPSPGEDRAAEGALRPARRRRGPARGPLHRAVLPGSGAARP
jgi:hypothetical protein